MDSKIIDLKSRLRELLESREDVIAAWEGGSAATGYLDDYSDLDLLVILREGTATDPVFEAMNDLFERDWGILESFRMPEPTWHGMSQCFYMLDKMPPLFYCDIALTTEDNPHKLTEPERHGKAVIWFDNTRVYQAEPMPEAEFKQLRDRVYAMATGTWWLMLLELKKALARDNWLAAQGNYNAARFRGEMQGFMTRLLDAHPNPTLLFTLPGDCSKNGKHNSNVSKLGSEIKDYAKARGFAWWDLFEVMGGNRSVNKWKAQDLASKDLIHFSPKGYMLQGYLFYHALMSAYKDLAEGSR